MAAELETRNAEIVAVSFPKRTIEVVVMPYETATVIHEPGRSYEEIVSRGAFDGIEERNGVIKVNLHHQVETTCGRATKFHPSRQEGLVAELLITRASEGEDILTKAEEGLLDASAGFALMRDKATGKPYPDAEVWEARARRRLNKLWLGHIALVPEPAYPTANVLAVRHAAPAPTRPNLERLELDRLRELASVLDTRYGVAQH